MKFFLPFESTYMTSYLTSIDILSLFRTVFEIFNFESFRVRTWPLIFASHLRSKVFLLLGSPCMTSYTYNFNWPFLSISYRFRDIWLQSLKKLTLKLWSTMLYFHMERHFIPLNIIPVATRHVKEAVDVLAPFCTELFNRSLTTGSVPSSFKAAYVTPLLKKVGLDPADVSSYRPISDLSMMWKLLERLVAKQLVGYLTASGLLPRLPCSSLDRNRRSEGHDWHPAGARYQKSGGPDVARPIGCVRYRRTRHFVASVERDLWFWRCRSELIPVLPQRSYTVRPLRLF